MAEPTTILTARVHWDNGRYVAVVKGLSLTAEGETADQARDELITALRSWIEIQDTRSLLETTLAGAGFPGVAEDTELLLEFVE